MTNMNAFDFSMRLDNLIIACLRGGNTPAELQIELIAAIKDLNNSTDPNGLVAISKETS